MLRKVFARAAPRRGERCERDTHTPAGDPRAYAMPTLRPRRTSKASRGRSPGRIRATSLWTDRGGARKEELGTLGRLIPPTAKQRARQAAARIEGIDVYPSNALHRQPDDFAAPRSSMRTHPWVRKLAHPLLTGCDVSTQCFALQWQDSTLCRTSWHRNSRVSLRLVTVARTPHAKPTKRCRLAQRAPRNVALASWFRSTSTRLWLAKVQLWAPRADWWASLLDRMRIVD